MLTRFNYSVNAYLQNGHFSEPMMAAQVNESDEVQVHFSIPRADLAEAFDLLKEVLDVAALATGIPDVEARIGSVAPGRDAGVPPHDRYRRGCDRYRNSVGQDAFPLHKDDSSAAIA